MNNTFSLNRFILLFKKYSVEHFKTNLLSTAVLAGLLAVILGFFSYTNDGRLVVQVQVLMFIYFMIGAGCIFTSLIFTDLGNKRKASQALTLPASHFEKYTVAWLYSYIIFQLLFVGVFYVVDFTVLSLSTPPANFHNILLNIFSTEEKGFAAFLGFGILHAFAFWGAVFFEKMHFIKTAFVFFIYLIAFALVNNPVVHLITGKKDISGSPFGQLYFKEGKIDRWVMPTHSMNSTNLVILAITIFILWASAYYRLKEKEV